MTTGRFAPSPSGSLHLGNLRTALLAWCFARRGDAGHDTGRFLLRIDDLSTGTGGGYHHERAQLADLAAIGVTYDRPVVRQSERRSRHDAALDRLVTAGLTYPCFCSRREVREAARAPHGPDPEGTYPGTCRELTRGERRQRFAAGHPAALRLRAGSEVVSVHDRLRGRVRSRVDDLVLRRADGVAAYNLSVVVDDADQGVDQVVRGDDLLDTTPRQVLLHRLLDLPIPEYAHVPLVVGPDGSRLSKRHGAVTLADRMALGETPDHVVGLLAGSVGLAAPGEAIDASRMLERFDPDALPRVAWTFESS